MSRPYISFVACSRNDNHGGSLTRRMQIFVDCLSEQCDRHKLRAELVLVEWNPPTDRKSLKKELRWRKGDGFCDVRIITVPPEIHRKYKCSEGLPLFQMIAKNVGIRRARGEFVLCTNIDIIFSDELMKFLAECRLEPGIFYRSIRMDADANVPQGKPVEEVLAYCRNNIVRVNLARHSIEVLPENLPAKRSIIRSPNLALRCGSGFVRHNYFRSPALLAESGTELTFDEISTGSCSNDRVLVVELALTSPATMMPREVQFVTDSGAVLKKARLRDRCIVTLPVPDSVGSVKILVENSPEPASTTPQDPSIWILQVGWINDIPFRSLDYDCYVAGNEAGILGEVDAPEIRSGGRRGISRRVFGNVYLQLPARHSGRNLILLAADDNGAFLEEPPIVELNGTRRLTAVPLPTGHWVFKLPACASQNYLRIVSKSGTDWYLTDVHVSKSMVWDAAKVLKAALMRKLEATFVSKDNSQKDPIASEDFELSPLNTDRVAKDGITAFGVDRVAEFRVQKLVEKPRDLIFEMMPGYLSGGSIQSVSVRLNGRLLHQIQEPTLPRLVVSLPPLKPGDKLQLEVEGTGQELQKLKGSDLLPMNYHAYITKISWTEGCSRSGQTRIDQNPYWFIFQDSTDCQAVRNPLDMNCRDLPELFFNACGDFTLAHRNVYDRVGGYAEMEIYSMHLDSLFLYCCWFEGFRELRLPEIMCHYHIEHGGGWTPEGHERLYRHLAAKKIGWLGYNHDLLRLAITMMRLGRPIYFNKADWGLGDSQLEESAIQ